jgi:predicted phage terminase large subunit-like protein
MSANPQHLEVEDLIAQLSAKLEDPTALTAKDRETVLRMTRFGGENKLRSVARSSLTQYTSFTLPRYDVTWFHQQIADLLEQVVWGGVRRLMVFAPPRHGKSELVSIRFPAFYLGHQPKHSVINCSYALDLAVTFSRATRNVIESSQHQRLFPMGFLDQGQRRWTLESKSAEQVDAGDERPSFISAGAGGAITGQGGHLINIDDPYKNYEEANSAVIRESIWNWYTSTARTRLMPDGAIVITQTRWHEDDLAGRLLRLAKENPRADQWIVVEISAVNDDGKQARIWSTDGSLPEKHFDAYAALWPTMYDREFLEKTRATQGPRLFAAMYEQKPQPATGNVIKREWLSHWYVTEDWVRAGNPMPTSGEALNPGYSFESCVMMPKLEEFDQIVQSWDFAFKAKMDSDFVAGHVWGKIGATKYLLDRRHARLNYPDSKAAVVELSEKWPRARAKYIEDKANGPAIIADLKGEVSGLIPVNPIGDKHQRLSAASVDAEAGNVILPWPGMYQPIYDFIECLCVFPSGIHDDDCDAFSQAMHKLKTKGNGLIEMWRRQAEAQGKAQAAYDPKVQPQEEKNDAFKFATGPQPRGTASARQSGTVDCPACGVKVSRVGEGRWKCNVCGAKGDDSLKPETMAMAVQ